MRKTKKRHIWFVKKNIRIVFYLTTLVFLSIDQLFAEELKVKLARRKKYEFIAKLNSELEKLNKINVGHQSDCNTGEQEELPGPQQKKEPLNDDAPIYAFQGPPPKIFTNFTLRNDYFAIPVTYLRYGDSTLNARTPIIFDQGETHGYFMTYGFMPSPDLKYSFSYGSNLYTDIVGRGPNNEALQAFTNEQLAYITFDNLHTAKLITYQLDLGYVEHDKKNNTDILRGSTQQEWWHNGGSDQWMEQDFYNIINKSEDQFESGLFIKPNIGVNSNYLSKNKHFGTNARLYIAPELSTLSKRNNVELGVSGYIYAGTNVSALKVGKYTLFPKSSMGVNLGADLPLSVHQMHGDKTSKVSTSFVPRANMGVNVGFDLGPLQVNTNLGYSIEMVNGTLPNHIKENKQYQINHPSGQRKDWGDMGAINFGINFTF